LTASRVIEPRSLSEFLAPRLASFKMPAHVFAIDAFPVTGGTEKIQKFKLRDMAIQRLSQTAAPRRAAR